MGSLASGPGYILASAPFRISFAGGGTDLPAFYRREGGAVLSSAIDQHVYVTVKRLSPFFGRTYRLNYSEAEIVDDVEAIRNQIVRECLKLVPCDPPLYIGVIADIPTSSGLGASSSFAVSLLSALHVLRGERVSPAQLAEEAATVEIEMLQRPIGKQDQYAAAFGGLNYFRFLENDRVTVEPQSLPPREIDGLFRSILMFWTGISRDAGEVLESQNARTDLNLERLRTMKAQADDMRKMTFDGIDVAALGCLLNEGWEMKRQLADSISSSAIDGWYRAGIAAGAYGGKLCGAGGGGFLMFLAPPERHDAIRGAMGDLRELKVGYEPNGVRIHSYGMG
ncbi:GHMP family kinase ATP-binding protein [Jiella marina]|uniref:GHMP family kinase ATP-binding protein n=1 Tax=Jiella sp. LLJ827 TaxID=2917712 RepID=UPI002100F430|nr:GHMP kinase [Jiella sp. LLJ827]MCQ0988002.1 GHMP kinase [Jiella sp. LLJ827]